MKKKIKDWIRETNAPPYWNLFWLGIVTPVSFLTALAIVIAGIKLFVEPQLTIWEILMSPGGGI